MPKLYSKRLYKFIEQLNITNAEKSHLYDFARKFKTLETPANMEEVKELLTNLEEPYMTYIKARLDAGKSPHTLYHSSTELVSPDLYISIIANERNINPEDIYGVDSAKFNELITPFAKEVGNFVLHEWQAKMDDEIDREVKENYKGKFRWSGIWR